MPWFDSFFKKKSKSLYSLYEYLQVVRLFNILRDIVFISFLYNFPQSCVNCRTIWCNLKFLEKKSHGAEKLQVKIAKGGLLVCFRGSGRHFCFERDSDISSMFWTSVVQVVE